MASKTNGKKSGKRKSKNDEDFGMDSMMGYLPEGPSISSGALRSVAAIFSFVLSVFLVLAEIGMAGPVGASVFEFLSWLFGIGYALLPFSFLLLSALIIRSSDRTFGWVQVISLLVFLLSSLGLVAIGFGSRGGIVGEWIALQLIQAIDTGTTVVLLMGLVVASLVVAFDVHLGELFQNLYERLFGEAEPIEEIDPDAEPTITDTGMEEGTEEIAVPEEIVEEEKKEVDETPKIKHADISNETAGGGFAIPATIGATYNAPPISMLAKNKGKPEVGDVKANANIIKRTLLNFGITVEMDEVSIGPTVTRYAMKPAEGVRLAKIVALQSNLELALAASPVRIEAPIPGKSLVGIEVPNLARTTLGMGPLLSEEEFSNSEKPLMMAMGRTITGAAQFADLAKMPHLLVAGTTGAGKSVTIHDFVISLLYRCGPEKLRFIMVDPKRVELTLYNNIPHLMTPVITDAKKAILALKWLAKEMDRRYNILETEKVRDIGSYHKNVLAPAVEKAKKDGSSDKPLPEAMPYIVLIIDELADIMQTYPRELEGGIVRLAQMSRAVGIHLILSTQRPSVKVITGLIKANIPSRVALQVASQIDSRTILDMGGAEKLLGAGDMLFLSGEMSKPRRVQATYLSEDEVKKVVEYIIKNNDSTALSEITLDDNGRAIPQNDPIFSAMADSGDDEDDDLYPDAKRTIIEAGKASTSYLQRKLGIGYARAARLMDLLEKNGIIGAADGAKPREVLGGTDSSSRSEEA